jgi:hydrogenase maturation protease
MAEPAVKPILVFAYGNPSRGDDALGPQLLDQLAVKLQDTELENRVDLLTDFQLQIEHSLDMEHRQQVVFVDASVSAASNFDFQTLHSQRDDSYSSHALSPAALLELYQQLHPTQPVAAFQLAIRGYDFELGQPITSAAHNNLQQGLDYLYSWLQQQPL